MDRPRDQLCPLRPAAEADVFDRGVAPACYGVDVRPDYRKLLGGLRASIRLLAAMGGNSCRSSVSKGDESVRMISDKPASVMTVEMAKANKAFRQQCLELLTPYYSNPEIPLAYAFDHEATHVYFSVGNDGQLAAVFFARAPEHLVKDLPLVGYMGLTATAVTEKDQHQARQLWGNYLVHSRQRARESELLAWYRTATPFGLYPCHHLLNDGEPEIDGKFSKEGAATVRKLRNYYGLPPEATGDHPFVVRSYASAHYSEFEQSRIAVLQPRKRRTPEPTCYQRREG